MDLDTLPDQSRSSVSDVKSGSDVESVSDIKSLTDRDIFAYFGTQSLKFPAQWVAEILLVERSQILKLPCYNPLMLGVIQHQGEIVPLISAQILLSTPPTEKFTVLKEILPVIRCNVSAEPLAGVGIVVHRVVEQLTSDQRSHAHRFQPTDVPCELWQPKA